MGRLVRVPTSCAQDSDHGRIMRVRSMRDREVVADRTPGACGSALPPHSSFSSALIAPVLMRAAWLPFAMPTSAAT
jgi:hypothetical protein